MFGRYGGERTSSESQSVLYMSPFEQPSRGSSELTIVGLMRSLSSANSCAKGNIVWSAALPAEITLDLSHARCPALETAYKSHQSITDHMYPIGTICLAFQ
jgi:hypothetical protein